MMKDHVQVRVCMKVCCEVTGFSALLHSAPLFIRERQRGSGRRASVTAQYMRCSGHDTCANSVGVRRRQHQRTRLITAEAEPLFKNFTRPDSAAFNNQTVTVSLPSEAAETRTDTETLMHEPVRLIQGHTNTLRDANRPASP